MKIFKMRVIEKAKATGNSVVYISSKDYVKLVRHSDINGNGVLLDFQTVTIKMDRTCKPGDIKINSVTFN